jgi:hypothetical protein
MRSAAISLLLMAGVMASCTRPASVSRDTQPASGASLVGTASSALSVEKPDVSVSLPASQQDASAPTSDRYAAVGPEPSAPTDYASFDNFIGCLAAEPTSCNCAALSEEEQAAVAAAHPGHRCVQDAAEPHSALRPEPQAGAIGQP